MSLKAQREMHERGWCQAGGRTRRLKGKIVNKRRYDSIDEAWFVAFRLFAERGDVLTPYRCTPILRCTSKPCRPHPNPWAFAPYLRHTTLLSRKVRVCCGGFHLTASMQSCLPA